MIVADRKPLDEILNSIKDYKKIMLMACGGCVTVCFSGGTKAAELLASQLRIAKKKQGEKIEIVECTPERQCEYEFIDEHKEQIESVEAVLSIACGVTLLAALSAGATYLFRAVRDRLLFVIGMASGGYMLLFFGYIENYPLFVLMVGIFSLAGLMIASDKISRGWIVLPLVGATLFHPFGLALGPTELFADVRDVRAGLDQIACRVQGRRARGRHTESDRVPVNAGVEQRGNIRLDVPLEPPQ